MSNNYLVFRNYQKAVTKFQNIVAAFVIIIP